MNIVRKIHDQFRVKTVAGAQLETPEAVSSQGAGGSTFITITGGGGTSLSGSGLSEEDRVKLDSIEQGAQVNQDTFSKIQFDATSIDENDQSSSSNSSIIANVPTDTANIKIVGNYPITVNLESVSLFNSNTSTTTGTAITTYNISFNSSNNIVVEYVDGTLLNVADIELIQIKHKEDILATYQLSDITYTTSDGTITSFTIPYSNTDFSEIEFCKYETVTTETEEGSTTVRELRVLSTLPASPTKQSIITLNSLTDSFWNYEEDENGNKFVWTDYNVYSTKDVSAYGRGAGTGGSSASNLYELNDVVLTNLSNNDLLIYDSSTSKWVNINKDQLGISADQLHTLTISVNGVTQATYNPASADSSVNISTITLNEVTEYIDQKIDTKLDVSEFFKWFTINYDSNNNVVSIQANFDFYSIGGVSAYGLGDIGGSSRTTLATLDDVSLSNLITNDMLAYNGSKWVNIPMSQVRGVTSWSDLENKPTTISGFGITDAYTKTEVNTKISEVSSKVTELSSSKADATIQVMAGDGLTGGGNLQQDITISLQNLNSTGTYYKVTVDTYGRVTSGISQLTITDIQNLQTQLDSKLNISDFNTWFTIIYNTDGTVKNIRANYDFYSVGEVSAYGVGDEEKKTYTTLAELNDVQLTNVKETDVLVYNGTKWVNVDQSTIKGAQSWVDIQNKPTTISGFGIVDAYTKTEIDNKLSPINSSITTINSSINTINTNISDLSSSLSGVSTKLNNFLEGSDTDTIINKWKELEAFLAGYTQTQTLADLLSVKANSSIQIIAGTGLVGGGDLTANRTISLSTSGVSAGTYTKVTVDTYGRVTSGSTLLATDVPNLDWSKITSGKPTTLAGYGITDGVNNITFTGSGNAITAVTISNHLLTFTKGETFLPKSTFDDLFEKVNVGTTSNPVYAIKAKYNLYSVGEVSAYEFGEAGGTGVSSLEELVDVQLTNLVADSILKYNGSKWVNIPITEVKGATSWNEIEDKPSTFTPSAHTHTVADITDISTKYVSISATQTVSGLKTFTGTVKYQPTYYSYNAEDIEYRTTSGTLFGGIGAVHNGSSVSYFYIGKGSTPWDTKDGLTIGDELGFKGYTVWHSGNTIIPTVPTKLSAFKNDSGYLTAITKAQVEGVLTGNITSHTHAYLPLTGGKLAGSLEINSTAIGGWDEGIRMHAAPNGYCGVVMCGSDNTGSSGTSAKTWGVTNYDGNFYINRNASGNANSSYILCNVNGNWGMGTNSPSYKLHVVGDIYTTTGFKKNGSSDSYVLLGGGGHKPLTDFAMASDYIKKASDTFWGTHTYTGSNHIFETTSTDTLTIFKHTGSGIPVPFKVSESSSTNYSSEGYGVLQIERLNTSNGWNNEGASLYFNLKDNNGNSAEVAGISGINTSDGKLIFRRRSRTVMGTMDSTGLSITGGYSGTSILLTNSSRQFITFNQIASSEAGNGPWILCQLNGTNKVGIGWNNSVGMFFEHYYNSSTYALLALGNSITYNGWSLLHSNNFNNYAPTLTGTGASGIWSINITGNAATATALTTSAGSATLPIYFSSGKPVACTASSVFSNLSNSGNSLSVTVAGQNRTLTVNYSTSAGNADTVDGYHASSFYQKKDLRSDADSIYDLRWNYGTYDKGDFNGTYKDEYPTNYGTYLSLAYNNKNSGMLMFFDASTSNSLGHVYVRTRGAGDWNTTYSEWGTLAYLTDNVASATKLQTPRTIWGQSFDGTANVDNILTLNYSASTRATGIELKSTNNSESSIGFTSNSKRGVVGIWGDSLHLWVSAYGAVLNIPNNSNGYVGIGTTSPSVKLHVVGDIAATGEVTAKASSSDIRLKTDITDYKALSIIRSHKSIKYHWNEVAKANADVFNDDYWHYGLIAQDVQRDMPQMVSDVFKDYLVINYERLIPICWKGLQEVDDEVTKLKKRVKQLERRLQKYESTEVFYTKGND